MEREASVRYECKRAVVTPKFTIIRRRIVRVGKSAAEHDQDKERREASRF